MNFSTKFSLLSLMLIFSMATPSRAMEEGAKETTQFIASISEAAKFANEAASKGFITKMKHLPQEAQEVIAKAYKQVQKVCQEKGGQFFAFAQANAERGIGILVTSIGTTYVVYRLTESTLKLVPMNAQTKEKYRNWIRGGMVVVGLGTAATLEYYGKNFNYILGKNKILGYSGLALTLAIALVYESSYIRKLLSTLPERIKQLPGQIKQIPGKMKEIPGAINNNRKKVAFGAGLVAFGVGIKKLGIQRIKDILNNNVMPTISKYSTIVRNHPRIATAVGVAAGAGALGYATYNYGYKKFSIDAQLAAIEQEINKEEGDLSSARKAALNKDLDTISTTLTTQIKFFTNTKNLMTNDEQTNGINSIVLPNNAKIQKIKTLKAKLNK